MSLEGILAEERELSLSSRNNKGKLHRKRGGGGSLHFFSAFAITQQNDFGKNIKSAQS